MAEEFKRISKILTPEQRQEYDEIRSRAKEEFPPLDPPSAPSEKARIALALRKARTSQGLTYEQVARNAGLDNADTVRDIEYGSDAKMSDVTAIAKALGLRLEIVSEVL